MHSVRTEGIVIALSDYGEADRIVTLFTLEHGKVRGMAKGARKSRRRFGGILELFARLSLSVRVREEGLWGIDSADCLDLHGGIRDSLERIGYAAYACELTDIFLPDHLANPRFYRLLCAWLGHLSASGADPAARRAFEINLLNIVGYRPSLEECGACGVPLDAGALLRGGELFCGACGRGGRRVAGDTLQALARSLRTGRLGSVGFSAAQLAESGEILETLICLHAGKFPKSLRFLREIAPVEQEEAGR